jgi:hypothetical protein
VHSSFGASGIRVCSLIVILLFDMFYVICSTLLISQERRRSLVSLVSYFGYSRGWSLGFTGKYVCSCGISRKSSRNVTGSLERKLI